MSCLIETLRHVSGRVVIVGDLHGCLDNLKVLLRKMNFSNEIIKQSPDLLYRTSDSIDFSDEDDMCVFVGDLINKGPDSFGCIRFLRDIGAQGVLGNHDIKMLRLREKLDRGVSLKRKEEESTLLPLARDCPPDLLNFVSRIPHVLEIPQHHVIVVHAGLDPTLPLERQEVEAVTRMRNLVKRSKYEKKCEKGEEVPEALCVSERYVCVERNTVGKPWAKTYSKLVSRITKSSEDSMTAEEEEEDDGRKPMSHAWRYIRERRLYLDTMQNVVFSKLLLRLG